MRHYSLSLAGERFIKGFEQLRLTAYHDEGGKPTIGWGTTYYPNGNSVQMGDTCTTEQAEIYFMHDIDKFDDDINKKLLMDIKQNQFDSMVSLWYNCGGSRTIMSYINAKVQPTVIYNWWCNHYITAAGKKSNGLIRRRKAEADNFMK